MYASACPWRFSKVHGNAFLLHDIQLPGWLGTIGRLAARAHATARHELGNPTASTAASGEVGPMASCPDGSGSDRNDDSRRRRCSSSAISSSSISTSSSRHSYGSSRRGSGASSCRSCTSGTSATTGVSSSGSGSSGDRLIPGTAGPSPTRGGRRRHRHPAQSDASSWSALSSSYSSSYSSSSSTSSFSICSSYFSPSFCRTTSAAVPAAAAAAAAAATVSSASQAATAVAEALTALTAPASGRQLRLPGGWAAGVGSSSCVHRQPHAHALRSAPLLVATTRRTIPALQSFGDEVERRAREARAGGAGAAAAAAAYASSAAGARSETPSEGSGAGAGAGAGGGGGGTGSRLLPLRAALRLLYKRVHPDLFHDQPLAKEENERSFKLLQEYVQLARGGDPRSPAARLPYRFAFYLRDAPQTRGPGDPLYEEDPIERPGAAPATPPLRPPVGGRKPPPPPPPPPPPLQQPAAGASAGEAASDGGGGGGDAASAVPGLHLVRVTLPPPAISPPGSKDLAGPTRKALVKLLAACGLATSGREAEVGEAGAGGEREAEEGPLSLAAFLPEAVEALRQAEAARPSDPAVRVANLRGALRLHHQVMVSFSDKQLPPAVQVALLERLARMVGSEPGLKLQLAGCHIVIGDRMGLDRMGHLCLSAAEPDDAWAAFLTGVDLDFVRQQRRSIQSLRSLEAQVARAVGVAQVFTPYGNLTEPSYREFLERLAAAAAVQGPLGGGAFRDVSVCGLPPVSVEPGQPEAAPPCRLDGSTPGVVNVSTDAAAVAVYAGVAQLGGQAQAEVRAARHVEGQLRELADKTRLRLRLRSLTRDPRVAPDHFRAACGLLLDQAAALMPLLEGCTVRIGFVNRLAPDGSCIEIAHNCQF